jgi:hypothetical protein
MGDRPGSFPGCAQVRTKVHRKDYDCFVGLVYDPTELSRVTTARPGVAGVLQIQGEFFVFLSFSYLFFAILAWFVAFRDFCWFCSFFFF